MTIITPGRNPQNKIAEIHGAAMLGTSVMGTLYSDLNDLFTVPTYDYSHGGAPVYGVDYSLENQITEAVNAGTFDCAILCGDNPAGSLYYGRTPEQAASDFGEQLDRLVGLGWFVLSCYRGVGSGSGLGDHWGADLRPYTAAMYSIRPRVHFADTWALFDRSDDLSHVIPGLGGLTVGDMFSDTPPAADHWSAEGARRVSTEMRRIFDLNAVEAL
jgi:hypothetical protein